MLIRVTLRDRHGNEVESCELPPVEAGKFAGDFVVTHASDPDVRNGVAGDGVRWDGQAGSIDFAPVAAICGDCGNPIEGGRGHDEDCASIGRQPADDEGVRNWGAEGVHWSGEAGDEIQRLDMPDAGEPRFEGDMEAAIYVAHHGFPWIVYEKHAPNIDDGRWWLTAYETAADAKADMAQRDTDDCVALFAFDGSQLLADELEDDPDGNGYLPPQRALLPASPRWTVCGSDPAGWDVIDGDGALAGPTDFDYCEDAQDVADRLNQLEGDALIAAIEANRAPREGGPHEVE